MEVKDFIIIALFIVLSIFVYHLYVKKETKKIIMLCNSTDEHLLSVVFSTEISVSVETQKVWDTFNEEIESVIQKLNLSGITKYAGYYNVNINRFQGGLVENNENKINALNFRGELSYKSESIEPLALLMDTLNKNDKYESVALSMSRDDDCHSIS